MRNYVQADGLHQVRSERVPSHTPRSSGEQLWPVTPARKQSNLFHEDFIFRDVWQVTQSRCIRGEGRSLILSEV